jgi:SAM-dependent methyltransferase
MRTSEEKIISKVEKYYTEKVREYGATPRGVDWKDVDGQYLRFEKLSTVWTGENNFSLGELGCGYGALADWLIAKGYGFNYVGYDISDLMILEARQKFLNFENIDFQKGSKILIDCDYVIASGIFNVKFDSDDNSWSEYVWGSIKSMAQCCNKGLAVNFLTSYADVHRKESRLYYPEPEMMFSNFINEFGRHVALKHDYDLYEFTITVKF